MALYIPSEPHARLQGGTLLFTRLVIAFIFLWHGVPKAIDIPMAMEKFVSFGLPGVLGPVIGWIEVVCGVLVVVGFRHRLAQLVLAAVILGALVTVQLPGGVTAGLERDLLILATTLLLAVQGPGLFALDERSRTEPAVPATT